MRKGLSCWLLFSDASRAMEAMMATSRRVLRDGPVANNSFIAVYLVDS
jgi:hypothetical protein